MKQFTSEEIKSMVVIYKILFKKFRTSPFSLLQGLEELYRDHKEWVEIIRRMPDDYRSRAWSALIEKLVGLKMLKILLSTPPYTVKLIPLDDVDLLAKMI